MRISGKQRGFTLVEVMAAVTIMGIGLVSLILAINRAKEGARITRNLKAVRNLATNLLAEIENGKFDKVYDRMSGNFASAGFPEFEYEIGVGEDTQVVASEQDLRNDDERRREEEEAESTENSDETEETTDPNAQNTDPQDIEYEQVTLRVTFRTLAEEPNAFVLIKKIPKDILEGKFDEFKAKVLDPSDPSKTESNASTNSTTSK